MNAYTKLIIIFICGSLGDHAPYEDYANVGTVLFTRSDLTKPHWNKYNIALLEARLHFQTLVPPPNFIDANTNYVDKLLNYFGDAYSFIKKETNDSELDIILTKALSDTIGGCFKQWILPVTKLAFYGGTITEGSANKLFKFYFELCKYLETDGRGWREPDPKLISSIRIAVVQRPHIKRAGNVDPCEVFAYLENTLEGLTIPMPYIDWQEKTMFVPLKAYPLIALNSPKHSLALVSYYDAAMNCLNYKNPNASGTFDDRFQKWLNSEVMPHLGDETLYVGLGSVLGLVNKSQGLTNTVMNMYGSAPQLDKYYISPSAKNFCTKKTVIIGIILLIEVIWCIIAVRHVCMKKDKRPGAVCNDVIMFFKAGRRRNEWDNQDRFSASMKNFCKQTSKMSIKQYPGNWSEIKGGGIKLHQKPKRHIKQYDFGAQHPSTIVITKDTNGTNTRSSDSNNNCMKKRSREFVKIVNETPKYHTTQSQTEVTLQEQPKGFTYLVPKSITPAQCSSFHYNIAHLHCSCSCVTNSDTHTNCNTNSNIDNKNTVSTMQEMHPSKTITLFKRSQRSIEREMRDSDENTLLIRRVVSERTGFVSDMMSKVIIPSTNESECVCCDAESLCPCTSSQSNEQTDFNPEPYCVCSYESSCTKKPDTFTNEGRITKTFSEAQTVVVCTDKDEKTKTQNVHKSTKMQMDREFMITRNAGCGQNFVEIKIDRPDAEISVGISTGPNSSKKNRTSKIPKRALTPTRNEDKTGNHSDVSNRKLNDQMTSADVKLQGKHDERVVHKQMDGKEQIHCEAIKTTHKELRQEAKKRDPWYRKTPRNEEISNNPLECNKKFIDKAEKYVKKDVVKGSRIPSKATRPKDANVSNKTEKNSNKPNRGNVCNKTLKERTIVVHTKATEEAEAIGDMEELYNVEIKKPDNILFLYKTSTSYPKSKHKSFMPQLKKLTADDTMVSPKKATVKDSKLNITL